MARRPNPTARDMVLAIGILLVPVLLISWFFTRIPEPPINPIDPAPHASLARAQSPYSIAMPTGLPTGWICVRARWTAKGEPGIGDKPAAGNTWQLGYLNPARMYLAIDQRDDRGTELVASASRDGRAEGPSPASGWVRFLSRDGRTRSLVRVASASTTVVSGDLPYAELEAFVATFAG